MTIVAAVTPAGLIAMIEVREMFVPGVVVLVAIVVLVAVVVLPRRKR